MENTILLLGFNYTFISNLLFPALVGIQNRYGLSATQLSFYAAIPALINILLQPMAGRKSDRLDRSLIILLGLGAYALGGGTIATGLLLTSSFGFILIGRSLMGLGELGAFPQYLALIRERIHPDQRQNMMGKIELFTSLGGAVAPALGGLLASRALELPFWGCALAALGSGTLFWLTMRKARGKQELSPGKKSLDDPKNSTKWSFHHSFLGGFLVLGILVVFQTFIGSYMHQTFGFSTKQIGFTLAVLPLSMALGAGLMIRNGEQLIKNTSLIWTGLLGILGIAIISWGEDPRLTILGLALIGLTLGFWLPSMDHDISEAGKSNTSGQRLSFFQQSKSLGILILPPLVGLLIDRTGSYQTAFILLGLFCLVQGIVTIQLRKGFVPQLEKEVRA